MVPRFLLLVLFISVVTSNDFEMTHHRQTRYLVYMPRGAFKLVLGLRIPMKIDRKLDLSWTINFQFQYTLPINVTQYSLPIGLRSGRSLRAIDRTAVYDILEEYLESHGFEGRTCILRSICEAATFPLHHDGILGQVMQIVLTPNWRHGPYTEARLLGERDVDCRAAYPSCPTSLLSLVSLLV